MQIAHNVTIGEHCLVVAQVGVAGSTKIGHSTILAGQAGLAGHLHIGNNVIVAAQSGVMRDIPDGGKWLGAPAQPDRQAKRQMIALQHLPELLRRVGELEDEPRCSHGQRRRSERRGGRRGRSGGWKTIRRLARESGDGKVGSRTRVWFNGRMRASQA